MKYKKIHATIRTYKTGMQCKVYVCPFCDAETRGYHGGPLVVMCHHYHTMGFDVGGYPAAFFSRKRAEEVLAGVS